MDNYTPTLEYQALMEAFRSRKFTKNDIKSFVYKVFSMYERATCENVHLDAEAFHDLVAEDVLSTFQITRCVRVKSSKSGTVGFILY